MGSETRLFSGTFYFIGYMWTYFPSGMSEAATALEKFLSDTRTDGSIDIADGRGNGIRGPVSSDL